MLTFPEFTLSAKNRPCMQSIIWSHMLAITVFKI